MYAHTPVLLDSVLTLLKPDKGQSIFVDATLGEGGHAEAFLSRYPGLEIFGVEADQIILMRARDRLKRFNSRIKLFRRWFTDFFKDYESYLEQRPDRILFDLGISMFHYEKSGRGFSLIKDEPLDMRIDEGLKKTASDIVNKSSENELIKLFETYGEEKMARRISHAIVRERRKAPIIRSNVLADIILKAVPPAYRYGRIHPATRTFQALRIVVNDELSQLREALEDAFHLLNTGGRLGVISFHSLEDRIVKHFFKERNKSCTCPADWPICQCGGKRELEILTRKPITASSEEIEKNPASRSAKFRAVEKLI